MNTWNLCENAVALNSRWDKRTLHTHHERIKIRQGFSHPASDKFSNFLKLAQPWKTNQKIREALATILKQYEAYQSFSIDPARLRFALPTGINLIFGKESMGLMLFERGSRPLYCRHCMSFFVGNNFGFSGRKLWTNYVGNLRSILEYLVCHFQKNSRIVWKQIKDQCPPRRDRKNSTIWLISSSDSPEFRSNTN